MVQRLNINNFYKHYIIRPFEAPKIDRLKAVISSIAIGILTGGLVHLCVFVKELCIKKIAYLNSLQKRVNQLNPFNNDNNPQHQLSPRPPKPTKVVDLSEPEFSNLSDHLQKMKTLTSRNQRNAEIKKMSFLNISQIVLEIREALIQKVRGSIPDTANNIVFLLGPTGAGKSTAVCFLRGDEMVLKHGVYESSNDQEGLIVHDLSNSGTFLPNVIHTENLILVDFPGFDDSNGPLVTLGTELALKVLVKEYNPKMLIIDSITDLEAKYAHAGELGIKLKRLFKNPDNCFLGLTKYNQNMDYANIKNIEEEQKKVSREEWKFVTRIELFIEQIKEETDPDKIQKLEERKQQFEKQLLEDKKTSSEVLDLIGQIETLKNLFNSTTDPQAKENLEKQQESLKQELEQKIIKHREKENKSHGVNPLILQHQKNVDDVEKELSKQIGVANVIKFSDLNNADLLISHREALSKSKHKPVEINPEQNLEPNVKELLNWVFQHDLIGYLHTYKPDLKDISNRESFYKSVSGNSLIYTIAPPEVSTLLHLPDMDSRLVLEYDRRIIDRYIQNYTDAAIGGTNVSLLEKILDKVSDSKKTDRLRQLIKNHKELIKGFLGVKPSEDQKKNEEKWKEIEARHQLPLDEVDQKFELPNWAVGGLFIPNVQITIHKLWQKYGLNPESKELIDEMTDEALNRFSSELEHIQLVLALLKKLEMIIKIKKYVKEQNEHISKSN